MNRGNHVLRSRRVWTAALATSTLALIAGSAAYVVADEHEEKSTSPHAAASAKALPKPVLDTHHLMELFNQQWYQLVKKELDSVLDTIYAAVRERSAHLPLDGGGRPRKHP